MKYGQRWNQVEQNPFGELRAPAPDQANSQILCPALLPRGKPFYKRAITTSEGGAGRAEVEAINCLEYSRRLHSSVTHEGVTSLTTVTKITLLTCCAEE